MKKTNWKFPLIFFLSLVLLGLLTLYVATLLPSESLSVKMLDHLGAALLILGGFGIFEKWAREREIFEFVANLFALGESIRESGLQAVDTDAQHHDFEDLVTQSPTLSLVFNDGNKWISSNFAYFDARFKLMGVPQNLWVESIEEVSWST